MAERLASTEAGRTRLLADLAHELRTPLATLEAYIDGLEDGIVPATGESYATMRDQVSRLRRLAVDLRESSAADEHALHLTPVVVDARAAAGAVAAALPGYRTKGVDLHHRQPAANLPATSLLVTADPDRLQQVLANLLDNALRHTVPGGDVTLEAAPAGSRVTLTVSDDGDGIPGDQLRAVFERFHRIDPSRSTTDGSGSGLGSHDRPRDHRRPRRYTDGRQRRTRARVPRSR